MIAHELKAFKEEDVLQRETESFKQALSSADRLPLHRYFHACCKFPEPPERQTRSRKALASTLPLWTLRSSPSI